MTRTVSKQNCFCVAVVIFSLLIFCGVYFFREDTVQCATFGEHTGLETGGREPLQIQHYISRNSTVIGKKFCFDGRTLLLVRNILLTQTFKRKPVTLTDAKTPFFDLVVSVTGCSSNHYGEFKKQIAHFAKQFPGTSVIFYDLGLDSSQVGEILTTQPFVRVRKFDFDAYPPHVRNLNNYAWKTLIIQQILSEFDGVMWFDSSVKFQENKTSVIMEQLVRSNSGFLFYVSTTGHSIITATHPGMMEYFPLKKEAAVKDMSQGGAVIVINKDEVQKHIMRWLVICVLKKDCIAPPGSKLSCGFNFPREKFGGCHRYDQSLLSILVSNTYNHDEARYHFERRNTFAVVNRG